VKKYPKPGHCAGLVQISPGQFSPGPEKVGIGPIPVQKLLGLDWTGLGRTRSGLVQCWTGGIIGVYLADRGIDARAPSYPIEMLQPPLGNDA
jgi:hypothetical protein